MPSQLSTAGFDRLSAKLRALGEIDYAPLAEAWGGIIEVDNHDGVLAGLDGWGRPLHALAPSTIKHRKSAMGEADPNAPPLIPAWERSRVISAFTSGWTWQKLGQGRQKYVVIGAWENVFTTKKGVQFLPFHFRGEGHLPRRDLAHIRPDGLKAARAALRDFVEGKL